MAPKKDKSKVEDEAVANLSTGWRKSKMSESAVQDLENMGLLQTHVKKLADYMQWCFKYTKVIFLLLSHACVE